MSLSRAKASDAQKSGKVRETTGFHPFKPGITCIFNL